MGLMVPAENHVDCSEEEEGEDAAFWETFDSSGNFSKDEASLNNLLDACQLSEASEKCCNAEGYGEMAPGAVEAIAAWFNLSATPTQNFFDLGSGAGRLVLHMIVKGYARAATGIELNMGRHSLAVELAQRVLPEHLPMHFGLANASGGKTPSVGATFLQGDMLSANLSSASMLYLN